MVCTAARGPPEDWSGVGRSLGLGEHDPHVVAGYLHRKGMGPQELFGYAVVLAVMPLLLVAVRTERA
ncbi:MAG: hypothetical protein NVSMB32_13330 [Actinomycetota bacterium]